MHEIRAGAGICEQGGDADTERQEVSALPCSLPCDAKIRQELAFETIVRNSLVPFFLLLSRERALTLAVPRVLDREIDAVVVVLVVVRPPSRGLAL